MEAPDLDPSLDYIFTVGHSNSTLEQLTEKLHAYEIEILADVRSQPVSRYLPHFNRPELAWKMEEDGIRYQFLGAELGGRPDAPRFYDSEGHVRYDVWSASDEFQRGITELEESAKRRRTAILCSEENPADCHRHLLVARVLRERGWPGSNIIHIRADGRCLADDGIPVQQDLFGGTEGWRSPQSVLHKVRREISSNVSREHEFVDS